MRTLIACLVIFTAMLSSCGESADEVALRQQVEAQAAALAAADTLFAQGVRIWRLLTKDGTEWFIRYDGEIHNLWKIINTSEVLSGPMRDAAGTMSIRVDYGKEVVAVWPRKWTYYSFEVKAE